MAAAKAPAAPYAGEEEEEVAMEEEKAVGAAEEEEEEEEEEVKVKGMATAEASPVAADAANAARETEPVSSQRWFPFFQHIKVLFLNVLFWRN